MGSLFSALMNSSTDAGNDTPDTAPASPASTSPAPAAAPPAATPTALPDSSPPMMNAQPTPSSKPDLPRFQRTFANTLKGIALGMVQGGIPEAIAGGIDPQLPGRQARANAQLAQANITFQSAKAAHEVAMAHQADVEYQFMPEKLQQEAEGRGLDDLVKAKSAGYLPIASVALDQGQAQNAANAAAALASVKTRYGAGPGGLLYIHVGKQPPVLKL